MRALLVEDDDDIADDVARALTSAGYLVERAADGENAWFLGDTEDFAVVVLDLGLPVLDGISVLKRWRAADRVMPVLILSARGAWTEKVDGIEAGADDYLAKPFEIGELVARVRALTRRAGGHASSVLTIGKLALDTRRMAVLVEGVPQKVSPLEYRLLDYLAHQQGRTVSAGELADHLHGADGAVDANAIEALVARIRRKIGRDVIETRRGFGYVLSGA
ncbi:response regulator transcription factor [Vitreimonas flagellata]|uniref:response regulator transcription factor n=1 Tax=Vitreimonas flagellata TaxID=2560861 RepID=UPI001075398C|nr:response regulator transcription factor [Vitreimonas flagellata]